MFTYSDTLYRPTAINMLGYVSLPLLYEYYIMLMEHDLSIYYIAKLNKDVNVVEFGTAGC